MEENTSLIGAMEEAGLSQGELAEAVNSRLRANGHEGTITDRTVRYWLTGKTRWPHRRQREALEGVFGVCAETLGFRPPRGNRTKPESPVDRRRFLTSSAAAVVRPSRVGTSDVIRLRSGLDTLMALDDTRGGHDGLEQDALAGASEALGKLPHAASQRIRQRLFSIAADYTATAAWSTLDARNLTRTDQHLNRALYLAGMAQDSVAELRVWNSFAMLAHQRRQHSEAVDAGYAAQTTGITRRDSLFASLAHARTAIGHSDRQDRQAAIRSLGHAHEALAKAVDRPRPSWIAFYGPAELAAITAIVRDRIGDAVQAEAASHQALAGIPMRFRRNRAFATTRLALAQLHQRDIETACFTASTALELMQDDPLPGRMRTLLGDFYRDLISLAPGAETAREWGDRYRSEWRRL
ncbi:XRE family transcriptional regulator [Streptomyces sp. NPDC093252]|uniref:XRE family transcriptional regulator n=1 Tax=Streptomyces sp. NPDC093252 TaxID=3154980 RepID=UPI003445BFE5